MPELIANGIRFHVQDLGTGGTPVVFLHGLVMDNLSSWYFTAGTRVAQKQRAILVDLRGHGRTERTTSGYDLDTQCRDVLEVLDALNITEPVHVVGNSFGGYLALHVALHSPEQVASVFLVDGHIGGTNWGSSMAASLRVEGEERDRLIAHHFQSWLGRHSARKRNRLAQTARQLIVETSLVADLEASSTLCSERLATLQMPIGGLYGTDSELAKDVRSLQEALPNWDLKWISGASHSVLWEHTERVVEEIQEWVMP